MPWPVVKMRASDDGPEFDAYVAHTPRGTPVYLDKALADYSRNPEAMMAAEIAACVEGEDVVLAQGGQLFSEYGLT